MTSNSRATAGSKDNAYNTLSTSYAYGYAGGRTDLPATGYDPVYPSTYPSTNQANIPQYQQQHHQPSTNVASAPQYQQQPQQASVAQYPYYVTAATQQQQRSQVPSAPYQQYYQEEYNPDYPSYSYTAQTDTVYNRNMYSTEFEPMRRDDNYNPSNTTFIPVNSSAFSVRNALNTYAKETPRGKSGQKRNRGGRGGHASGSNSIPVPLRSIVTLPKLSSVAPVKQLGSLSLSGNGSVGKAASSSNIIRINTSPVKKKSDSPDIIEVNYVPAPSNKKALRTAKIRTFPKRNNSGGRGGVGKRRSFESVPNNMQLNHGYTYGRGYSNGRGFAGRLNNSGNMRRRGPPRAQNTKDDIPFVTISEDDAKIELSLDWDNIVCFNGPSNVFTTQHMFPILIEDKVYETIDHYYQIQKVKDLCESVDAKLTETVRDDFGVRLDGKSGFRSKSDKTYGQLAREQIRNKNISAEAVEEWRRTKGLEAVQTALLAKVSQSAHLREAIKDTTGKILVHCYSGDSFYGTGTTANSVRLWCEAEKKKGVNTLKIPALFPLSDTTVKNVPHFAMGRNVLGVLLMQLRDQLKTGTVKLLDMRIILEAMTKANDPVPSTSPVGDVVMEDVEDVGGFAIGGGSVQPRLGDQLG